MKKERNEMVNEKPEFLKTQLITYLGNKRKLLSFIEQGFEECRRKLGKEKVSFLDLFSGTGVVARYFKQKSSKLIVNDLERYSQVTNECYLSNESEVDIQALQEAHEGVREAVLKPQGGFLAEMYAPRDSEQIQAGERVFYTRENALFLDTARQKISEYPEEIQKFLIAPLLSEASIHANTSGVFKGFYKNSKTGIGQFGGNGRNAIGRIMQPIELPFPVFSNFECEVEVHRKEATELVSGLAEVDIAYLDPPYNQHPYGSNYFMLNLICDYRRPENVSRVSGIPTNWNRSSYNKKNEIHETFRDLIRRMNAKFVLVSFSNEGLIAKEEMIQILEEHGKVKVLEKDYNTFRGSRNLSARNRYVREFLFVLERR